MIVERIKCGGCGILLDYNDTVTRPSYLCEYGEVSCYEDTEICPVCGSTDLFAVRQCTVCGEYHIDGKGYDDVPMYDGICEKCLSNMNVDTCVKIAEKEGKHMIEINAFLDTAFTPEEIEDILIEAIKRSPKKAVVDYVLGDPDWFVDQYRKMEEK